MDLTSPRGGADPAIAGGKGRVQPFDPAVVQSIREMGTETQDLLREVVSIFLNDAPESISKIRRAIDSGDAIEAAAAAHRLKGGAGNFGAARLVETAARTELSCRAGKLNEAEALIPSLEEAFDNLRDALLHEVAEA